jgi:hypothetical protein
MAEEIQPGRSDMDISGLRELLVRAGILREVKDNATDLQAILDDTQVQERTLLLQLYMWICRHSPINRSEEQQEFSREDVNQVGLLDKHLVCSCLWVLLV